MPFIHLNGTSLEELQEGADAAYHALNHFVKAWISMRHHPRDYYLREGAWERAQEEREQLNQKISAIHDYLVELREHLCSHV